MKINYFMPFLLVGWAGVGCATGLRFTAQEEIDRQFFDDALKGEIVIEKPSATLLVGEKLTYDVKWLGIPVGQVILENHGLEEINGEEAYHLTCATFSNKFLSNFFKIEDTVHTWISPAGGYPVRFEKEIKEGHYTKHQVVEYDHENLTATYHRIDKKRKIITMPIPPAVQDVFSTLYWVRQQDLTLGQHLLLDVNADEKNWVVEVEIKEKGVFDTKPIGKVKAFTLKPTASHNGKPLEKGKILVWLTADHRRIPLAFKIKANVFGSATVVLVEAVLPPLPEYHFLASEEGEDFLFRVYQTGAWLNGLTQADASFLGPRLTR